MTQQFSVCALFYGNHPGLARRCLDSIERALPQQEGRVRDFRLGCNDCCEETQQLVRQFAKRVFEGHGIPSWLFFAGNVCKYPMMRKMFYHEPLPDWVMWFDDDSYLESPLPAGWWEEIARRMERADMLGQIWFIPIQGNQWEWVQTLPWYNPAVGPPRRRRLRGRPCFEFCQGAWWVIRSSVLQKYDWPIPELQHNGGDSLLGELFRHQGLRMAKFDKGVRINAGPRGEHSKAKRRGVSQRHVGADYDGRPLPTGHQHFDVRVESVPEGRGVYAYEVIQLF